MQRVGGYIDIRVHLIVDSTSGGPVQPSTSKATVRLIIIIRRRRIRRRRRRRRIAIKKQLYINKVNLTIECRVNKANILSFTCHFSIIFNNFINLYQFFSRRILQ